jgi:hypothetical protein
MRFISTGYGAGASSVDPPTAPLQGPAGSVRAVEGGGSFYLMPPAKPWMNFFCANR